MFNTYVGERPLVESQHRLTLRGLRLETLESGHMRILVFGGTGFLGRSLIARLRLDGHVVASVSRANEADVSVDLSRSTPTNISDVLHAFNPNVVYNLAGMGLTPGSASIPEMESVNAIFPATLAVALRSHPDVLLIHVASSTEPSSSNEPFESEYSRTKFAGRLVIADAIEEAGLTATIATMHNVYGPTQPSKRLVRSLFACALARQEIVLNYPFRVRDFIYIDDAVEQLVARALDLSPPASTEIGTGHGHSVRYVAEMVCTLTSAPTSLISHSTASKSHRDERVSQHSVSNSPAPRSLSVGLADMMRRLEREESV